MYRHKSESGYYIRSGTNQIQISSFSVEGNRRTINKCQESEQHTFSISYGKFSQQCFNCKYKKMVRNDVGIKSDCNSLMYSSFLSS